MSGLVGNLNYPVDTDMSRGARVMPDGNGVAQLAGLADEDIGTLEDEVVAANVSSAAVCPRSASGAVWMIASAAIADNAEVGPAANGKIVTGTGIGRVYGKGAAGDGSLVLVVRYG